MSIFDNDDLWKPKTKEVTKEDVERQKQLDSESMDDGTGTPGRWADLISSAVTNVPNDTIGFLGDLGYDVARFATNMAKGGMHSDPTKVFEGLKEPGQGPVGKKAGDVHDKVYGKDVIPVTRAERMGYAGARGAADMVPFAAEAPASAILSGLSGGLSSQAASEAFPDNHWLPWVAGLLGGGIPGATHHIYQARATKAIAAGIEHPNFAELLPAVIGLEDGGTLESPKYSPKGAMGIMQVMPDTAAHPGFGIKPWDGKSQADLARVGRDYLAVMTRKYDGDHAKVLAAYNAGPGKVDSLIRRFGDEWAQHLPEETKGYVEHGLQKIVDSHLEGPAGPDGAPTNGSVPPIPSEDLARLMGDPAAAGLTNENWRSSVMPEEAEAPAPANDIEIPKIDNSEAHAFMDEMDRKVQENPDYQPTPAEWDRLNKITMSGWDDMSPTERQSASETFRQTSGKDDVLTPAERQEMDASVSEPPTVNNATDRMENFSTNEEHPAPANDKNIPDAVKNALKNLLDDDEGAIKLPDFLMKKKAEEPPMDEPPSDGSMSPEELFGRVSDALKKAVPARAEQKKLYSAERSKRVKEISQVRQVTGGVEGFHAEKAKLKGELPVADYSGLTGLGEQDIHALFDHVKNHPNLGYLQSINAREGLAKMLQGKTPTSSEIALLSRTMPPELLKQLRGSKGLLGRIAEHAANVLNIPKALMASFDVSAPMRQGVLMIGRKEFYSSLFPMVRALVSPKYQEAVFENIYRDPLFSAMQDSDLAVPVYKQHNGGPALMDHEEPYMTNLAQKIPLVGIGIRASERAYNTFVYKLRADTFKSLYNLGKAQGKTWDHDSLKDLSRFINTFTGRGDLGRFNNMAPILNSALFSPKLLKSRIDSLNPAFYAKLDPFVRKEAMKSMMSFAAFAITTLGLAKLAGAEVGMDPRKADGWKIKLGNTRWDILGGEQQLVRLMGNIATYGYKNGKELVTTGKIKSNYKDKNSIDAIGQFFRNKESPDISLAHDFLSGHDAVGQDVTAKQALLSRVTPMVGQDIYDAYSDLHKAGAPVDKAILLGTLKASPSLIGIGATTYPPHVKKGKATDPFSDPTLWGEKDEKDIFNDPKIWGQ